METKEEMRNVTLREFVDNSVSVSFLIQILGNYVCTWFFCLFACLFSWWFKIAPDLGRWPKFVIPALKRLKQKRQKVHAGLIYLF